MQIRTQLNENWPHSTHENVVQKVFETSHARQNETRLKRRSDEIVYIQVSSNNRRDLHKKHYKWSLCSIDKFKSNCSLLIKYLLVNSFLLGGGGRLYFILSKCFRQCHARQQLPALQHEPLFYGVLHLVIENNHRRTEPAHKNLLIDKSFILFLLHSTTHQSSKSTNFYIKLYKILLNLFYEYFNNKTNCHHLCRYQHRLQHPKIYFNPHSSINAFCDLSTNSKSCGSRNVLFVINEMSGVEHQQQSHPHHNRCHVKLRTLNFLYGILLIQRHVMCNSSYEFSDNHNVHANVKHCILLQLLAHNQMILYVTATWHYRHHQMKFQMPDDKSCHEIENGISTLATTSNHKLKATAQNDNDTCHHESEKFSNCYQQFHRTFRSNDSSVKSHLNAILFLIILCIPLLTAASSVHNLKYSTNVVKTKYGPLRGIILRSTPTVEGYLGVPYGESFSPFEPLSLTIMSFDIVAICDDNRDGEWKATFVCIRHIHMCVDKWLTHFSPQLSLLSYIPPISATPPLGSLRLVIHKFTS